MRIKHAIFAAILCTVADGINIARPGAEWSLQGNTLNWLDTTQTKPTLAEIQAGVQTCQATLAARLTQKQQARLDVRNSALTQAQRLQALLILLDYDQ